MKMEIRRPHRRKGWYRCYLLTLSLVIVCLLKLVNIKETVNNRLFLEPHGNVTGAFGRQSHKDINCTAIYQLDSVEIGKALEIKKEVITLEDESIVSIASNCQRFIVLRGYADISVSSEERLFPLAYSMVVHKDAYMVERLLRAIYVPHNIYCIHYDQKSSKSFITAMETLANCFPNVFVASKLESVLYAHITRLNADLNCLSDLLKSTVKWKYVINLCGQDFPLRSNFELVSELKKLKGANMLETSRPSKLKELRFTFQHLLENVQSEYPLRPMKTNQTKAPPPHGLKMFVGSAYFVLTHEFVSYVFESQLAKDFLSWSADTFSPDEHFWATLVRVPGVPGEVLSSAPDITDLMSKTRLVKWSYLENELYPPCTGIHQRGVCIYGAAELRWLLQYGHWFANKFDPKIDPVLIQCMEERIEERQLNLVNL